MLLTREHACHNARSAYPEHERFPSKLSYTAQARATRASSIAEGMGCLSSRYDVDQAFHHSYGPVRREAVMLAALRCDSWLKRVTKE